MTRPDPRFARIQRDAQIDDDVPVWFKVWFAICVFFAGGSWIVLGWLVFALISWLGRH